MTNKSEELLSENLINVAAKWKWDFHKNLSLSQQCVDDMKCQNRVLIFINSYYVLQVYGFRKMW